MRIFEISENSYLLPLTSDDLYIDRIVYLKSHDNFIPMRISAFNRDKEDSVILTNKHYVSVAYPRKRIYTVRYF